MSEKRKWATDRKTDLAATLSSLLPDVQIRPIRPRPVPYNQKLRVWNLDDPEFARYNPALAKWLRERVALAHALQDKPRSKAKSKVKRCKDAEDPKIRIPGFKVVEGLPQVREPEGRQPAGEQAYIRHIEKSQEELEERVEYDLDSEDEEWLKKRQKKGLKDLDVDLLEMLMDRFEKAKHAVLCERQEDGEDGDAPEEKEPGVIYPASKAIQDFGRDYNSVQLRAAHKYWSQKAANSQTPLLQRFWYDKRWARQNALKTRREEADDDDSSDDDLPFQGKNSPRKLGPRGRLLSSEDVRQRLLIARTDLEKLRTLADQVKRREKLKKKCLVAWNQEMSISMAMANEQGKKRGRHIGVKSNVGNIMRVPKVASPASILASRKIGAGPQATTMKDIKHVTFGMAERDQALASSSKPVSPRSSLILTGRSSNDRLRSESTQANVANSLPGSDDLNQLRSHSREADSNDEALEGDASDNGTRAEGSDQSLVGFERMPAFRGKPPQWHATCKAGKYVLKSIMDIQSFLTKHGHSRSDWKSLLQQSMESSTAYRHRLRLLFPFSDVVESPVLQNEKQTSQTGLASKAKNKPSVARKGPIIAAAKKRPAKSNAVSQTIEPLSAPDYFEPELLTGRTTRGGTSFGTVVPMSSISRQTQVRGQLEPTPSSHEEPVVIEIDDSSCSETCISADSDRSDQDTDAPRSALRPSIQKTLSNSSRKISSFRRNGWDSEDSEDASDMSAYPDNSDDPPPLPPTTRSHQVLRSLAQSRIQNSKAKPKPNRGIVAAARQRAKRQRGVR